MAAQPRIRYLGSVKVIEHFDYIYLTDCQEDGHDDDILDALGFMEFKNKAAIFNVQITWDDVSSCYSLRFTSFCDVFPDDFQVDTDKALNEMRRNKFEGVDLPESAGL